MALFHETAGRRYKLRAAAICVRLKPDWSMSCLETIAGNGPRSGGVCNTP